MSCRPPPQARVHPGPRRTFPHAWFMGRPGLRMAWARTMGPASWPAAQGHQQNSWALKSNTCSKISRLQDCIRGLSSPFLSLWHGPAPRLGGREGRIPRTSWPTWSLTALGPDRGRGQGGPERPERIASAGVAEVRRMGTGAQRQPSVFHPSLRHFVDAPPAQQQANGLPDSAIRPNFGLRKETIAKAVMIL